MEAQIVIAVLRQTSAIQIRSYLLTRNIEAIGLKLLQLPQPLHFLTVSKNHWRMSRSNMNDQIVQ